jgi:hypothetical protein
MSTVTRPRHIGISIAASGPGDFVSERDLVSAILRVAVGIRAVEVDDAGYLIEARTGFVDRI